MNPTEEQLNRLQEENRRLRISIEELSILNEIATAISSTLSLDKIIDLIVHKCVKHFNAEQSAVMLLNREEADNKYKTFVRGADKSTNFLPYHLDNQLAGWILKHKRPLLTNDIKTDDRFTAIRQDDLSINSLLSVPLLLKGQIIGFLNVFNKKNNMDFSEDDQRLLSIIAAQSAQVIENARLYLEAQELNQMQAEMRLAHQIQINLLPLDPPQIGGYDIAGKSIAAKDVGGDYYDFIPIDDKKTAICLGDVSGKGMPAAILMANLQATLRAQTMHSLEPFDCINRSNTLLFKSTDIDKYATLFYGILDKEKHEITYTNAGHDIPYHYKPDKTILRLKPGGIVVGFLEKFDFTQEILKLDQGDVLVFYSDGITEAMNEKEEEFGEEELNRLLQDNLNFSAEEIIDKIMSEIRRHSGQTPQDDDMTVVVVKRNLQ